MIAIERFYVKRLTFNGRIVPNDLIFKRLTDLQTLVVINSLFLYKFLKKFKPPLTSLCNKEYCAVNEE